MLKKQLLAIVSYLGIPHRLADKPNMWRARARLASPWLLQGCVFATEKDLRVRRRQ